MTHYILCNIQHGGIRLAINKAVMAAIKALSYIDIDIKKNYKIERQIKNASFHSILGQKRDNERTKDFLFTVDNHEIPVRLFMPYDEYIPLPLIIFFHGGGWVTGNIDTYDRMCLNMARLTNHNVISVDYRLAPEYKFPMGLIDCYNSVKIIYNYLEDLGVMHDMVTLAGDSAGGNLSAAVSLMLRDNGDYIPKRQILIYPATYNHHTDTSPFESIRTNGTDYLLTSKKLCDYLELYRRSDEDLLNPYFAPLIASDLTNQPDTLVITAEYDPLRDEGEAYGKCLEASGNRVIIKRVADALHGYFSLPPFYSQVRETYKYINEFLMS